MSVSEEELYKKLSDAVVEMNEDEAVKLSKEIVA